MIPAPHRSRARRLTAAALVALLATGMAAPQRGQGPVQPTSPASVPRPAGDESLERGVSAFQKQEWETAWSLLLPLARGGEPEAQCLVALMLQKGYGAARDAGEAVGWYTRSALAGWVDALFMLGQCYYQADGIEKSLEHAADLFLLAAITGDADGEWAFGVCLAYGEGRPKDAIEGGAWLQLAANQGHEGAQKELAQLVQGLSEEDQETGAGVARQLQEMIERDGFDPAKMPLVPVPPALRAELAPRTPPRLAPNPRYARRPAAAAPELVEAEVTIAAEMLPTGDMRGQVVLELPPELLAQMKELVPDPRLWLRDLVSGRADEEIGPDTAARYSDDGSVLLDVHMLGAVHNAGDGLWQWEAENHEPVAIEADDSGRVVARFALALEMPAEGFAFRGSATYRLPEGAARAAFDSARGLLSYHLPYAGPRGRGRLAARFDVRDRIMGCLYKVYGMETDFAAQWVAKAVFTNTGDGPLNDLRVRFRLGTYSELDLWQKFPEVVPGQTVVAVYHPVLSKAVAELTSTTPTNVLCEWRYEDAEGREEEDSEGGRIAILGRHEFVFSNLTERESTGSYFDAFSNADLVAAWVSRDDPVVKQFAAAANKAAGGAGAPYSDEAAWKVLKACYELWQANDFTYQGPVGLADASLSFDNKTVQSIKFPRDVIRDRSGTCIELTCLYCAMAHAVGLKPFMVLIPGHAFPAVRLPSGNILPVESTGVGGGQRYGTASFAQVVEAATANFQKAQTDGQIIVVDIEDAWTRGVSSPELPEVPADVLERWKVVLEFSPSPEAGPAQGPQTAQGPQQPNRPQRAEQPGGSPVGKWAGQVQQPLADGRTFEWPMVLEIRAAGSGRYTADFHGEARVPNEWGGTTVYVVDESFEGTLQGDQLALRGTAKTVTVNGVRQSAPADRMTASVVGGRLRGTTALAEGGSVTFVADRER